MQETKEANDSATGTQLLDRAVAVLRYLGDVGQQGASMAAIGEALGLKQSTAHRIVTALQRHGLIDRELHTKRYRLGLTLFAMGATAADGTGLRRLARPALVRLSAETSDTLFLMARAGFNAVCVDRQEGTYFLDSLTGYVGGQIPLGVGPASLAILAFLPDDEAEAIVCANASRYDMYKGLSADRIRAALPQVREQGYAVDQDELVAGIAAMAIPILPQGRDAVAAIAINMTSPRLPPERLQQLLGLLRSEVRQIEEALNPLEGHRIAPLNKPAGLRV
ncbi:IclR family transcriptional regulator [Mesorhizobium sp. M0520]|uniref:IclR family transcriptional regulator n=1 Tax=unclassified Mesorhizobium TaxID=325217 RepID=UPI003335F347